MVTSQHFSVLMVTMLLNTAITTPLLKLLYNPSARYVARKRRTIQHAKAHTNLRVLACVYNEDNVAGMLDLLEASHPTLDAPISVTVLHLTELAGRTASTLRPYKKSKRHRSNATASDRIANAFRFFEQQSEGVVSVHPYTAIAPYATMHNDVCALAHAKKARLILLPFHKQSDGARETARSSIRTVNSSVLDHAPCSVAILVDRGLPSATCTYTNHLLQRIAVYFIGGADDREALAYGMRMAEAESIGLTVVRFIRKADGSEPDEEGQRDDEVLMELRDRQMQNDAILYMERSVADGEGMVEVVQSVSEKYDLLIVGRRKGVESEMTKGMSEWSECPELGILGDMLSATDFGQKVSILVVQQQEPLRGGGSNDVSWARELNSPEEGKDVLIHAQVNSY